MKMNQEQREKRNQDIQALQDMFVGSGDMMTRSVLGAVLDGNNGSVDQAIDVLFNMIADLNVVPDDIKFSIHEQIEKQYPYAPEHWKITQSSILQEEEVLKALKEKYEILKGQEEEIEEAKRLEEIKGQKAQEENAKLEQERAAKEKDKQRESEKKRVESESRLKALEYFNKQKEEREKKRLTKEKLDQIQLSLTRREEENRIKKEAEEKKLKEFQEQEQERKKQQEEKKANQEEEEKKKREEEINARVEVELKRITKDLNSFSFEERGKPPVICIYTKSNDTTIATKVTQMEQTLKSILKDNQEIKIIDVSDDFEVAAYLKEKVGGAEVVYPLLFIHDIPINEQRLTALQENNALEKLLGGDTEIMNQFASTTSSKDTAAKGDFPGGTGIYHGQGILDRCLDAAEYVTSGVSTVLWLPVTIITWPFRSSPEPLPEGIDFDVVHTNWYWRNLRRRFRFLDHEFLRLHPTHMDVRSKRKYDDVQNITFLRPDTIVLKYRDNSSVDYITALPNDCENIAKIITSRATNTVHVIRLE